MKTTLADKLAVASLFLTAGVALGGVVFGVAAERRAAHLVRTRFAQPTPEFPASVAAGQQVDVDDVPLAQSK